MQIKKIFREIDPAELISEGAPDDEYNSIAMKIGNKIRILGLRDKIESIIANEFINSLDLKLSKDKMDKLVNRILKDIDQ